jgi:hypothetical protein
MSPVADASRPTQHGLLVCWSHFAQEVGLLEHLQAVPIPQKTVRHSPAARLTTLFMGLLSGIEYLTDLTHAPAPLYPDAALAAAWGLTVLPEAHGVSRTLTAAGGRAVAPVLSAPPAAARGCSAPLYIDEPSLRFVRTALRTDRRRTQAGSFNR